MQLKEYFILYLESYLKKQLIVTRTQHLYILLGLIV